MASNIVLALAWAALQGEFSLMTLLTGYVLGFLIRRALVRGGVLDASPYVGTLHLGSLRRLPRAASLAAFFLWELVRANLKLAHDVATPSFHMQPGIVAVPLAITKDSEILLLAMLINLTPGSVALDVSPDRSVMYVHVMYIDTPEAARAEIKDGFERRVLEVLG